MTQFWRGFALWLVDYYVVAGLLMTIALLARRGLRQPVARVAVAWCAAAGLALLAVMCAVPTWPRLAVLTKTQSGVNLPRVDELARVTSETLPHSNLKDADGISHLGDQAAPASVIQSEAAEESITANRSILASDLRNMQPASNRRAAALQFTSIATVFAKCFAFGSAGVVVWLFAGALYARRIVREATSAPEVAQEALRKICRVSQQVPRLPVTARLDTAAAIGVFRPTILLPASSIAEPGRSDLSMLLAHETAHINRRDLWLVALMRLLLVVLCGHPLYWWLRRGAAADQEHAADAVAAAQCGRHEYAACLVAQARRQRSRLIGAVAMSENGNQLSRRIAMLLDERIRLRLTCSRVMKLSTAAIATVAVLVLSLVTLRPTERASAEQPSAVAGADKQQTFPPAAQADVEYADPNEVARVVQQLQFVKGAASELGLIDQQRMSLAKFAPLKELADHVVHTGKMDIAGQCVDENQQPLAEVRLVLIAINYKNDSQRELEAVRSDADGRFRFRQLDGTFAKRRADTFRWFGEPALYVVGKASKQATVVRKIYAVEPNDALRLCMPAAASLRGRVTDPDGKPIAGANVSVGNRLLKEDLEFRQATTDADGRYDINDLTPFDGSRPTTVIDDEGKEMVLGIESVGASHPDFAATSVTFAKLPTSADITLPRPATIEGRVVYDDSDKPAAGVSIECRAGGSLFTATTDADGKYAIRGRTPGEYELLTVFVGWPPSARSKVQAESGKNVIDFRLKKGGKIKGLLTELATGKPPIVSIPKRMLMVMCGQNEQQIAVASINEDGAFEFDVPAGTVQLCVMQFWSFGERNRWIFDQGQQALVKSVGVAAGETTEVELKLLRPKINDNPSAMNADELNRSGATAVDLEMQSELAAAAAIEKLGGAITREKIDGHDRVVGVDMVSGSAELNFWDLSKRNRLCTDAALFFVSKLSHLKALILWRGQATDQGLAQLHGCRSLESLNILDAWVITDAGAAHIASMPNLKNLWIGDAQQWTDQGVEHLSKLARIESLMIDGGRFTDDTLKHLGNMTTLQSLIIQMYPGEFEGLDPAQQALLDAELPSIGSPVLKLTDAGLLHLRNLKNLKMLAVPPVCFSKDALKKLSAELPNAKVLGLEEEQK